MTTTTTTNTNTRTLSPLGQLLADGLNITVTNHKKYNVPESLDSIHTVLDSIYTGASMLAVMRERGHDESVQNRQAKYVRKCLHQWFMMIGTVPNLNPDADEKHRTLPCFVPNDADLVVLGELCQSARTGLKDKDLVTACNRFRNLFCTETALMLRGESKERFVSVKDVEARRDELQAEISKKAKKTKSENALEKAEAEKAEAEKAEAEETARKVSATVLALNLAEITSLIASLSTDINAMTKNAKVKARIAEFTDSANKVITAIEIDLNK